VPDRPLWGESGHSQTSKRGAIAAADPTNERLTDRYTAAMLYTVKIMRQRDVRRSEPEILSEAGTDGQLTGAIEGISFELKLYSADGSRMKPIIPVLLDARLVSMHGDNVFLCGSRISPAPPASLPGFSCSSSYLRLIATMSVSFLM
jgi:hypothetical protein